MISPTAAVFRGGFLHISLSARTGPQVLHATAHGKMPPHRATGT